MKLKMTKKILYLLIVPVLMFFFLLKVPSAKADYTCSYSCGYCGDCSAYSWTVCDPALCVGACGSACCWGATYSGTPCVAPSNLSVTTSPAGSVTQGLQMTFTASWTGGGPGTQLHICKKNELFMGYWAGTEGNYYWQSIPNGACSYRYSISNPWSPTGYQIIETGTKGWCEGGSSSCSYNTVSADTGTQTYYAFVCDNRSQCSPPLQGTFTVGPPLSNPSFVPLICSGSLNTIIKSEEDIFGSDPSYCERSCDDVCHNLNYSYGGVASSCVRNMKDLGFPTPPLFL